jgi:TonB-linked SusC/RagA family outer membrane protein
MKKTYLIKYVLTLFFALFVAAAFSQTGTVSGTVVDETNQPLPAATIVVQGMQKSTSTDLNGKYRLTGLEGTVTIEYRFLGYITQTKTVTVTGNVTVNVNLVPNSRSLNEVVVIGYGTARKQDVTGATQTLTAKDFNQGPITTADQLIQGKVAGVQITSNGGAPGSGSTIRIRGGASLNASNDPLIVVDGIPLSNNGISGSPNGLNLINPNDIESETILKDASATAIYGSRASNGVIIITTKKGKSDKVHINASTINSVSNIIKEVPNLNTDQFKTLVNTQGTAAQKGLLGSANTNWQDQIYRQAYSTDNSISLSGGIKALPYRLSFGYLDQDGILKTSNLKRTTVDLNINHDFLNSSLHVDFNLKGSYSASRFANQGAIGAAVSFDPTQPVYSGNNKYGGFFEFIDPSTNLPNTLATRNPLGMLVDRYDLGSTRRSLGNAALTYTFPFLKDLKANANFGYDVSRGQGGINVPVFAASDYSTAGYNTNYRQDNVNYVTDYYLNYVKDLKSISSHIDLTGGYSYQYFRNSGPPQNYFAADQVTVLTSVSPTLQYLNEYYIESLFGRLNYSLMDKYLLTATIRRDGSSRFSPENRYGIFPSASLAWRINQESFLKDSKTISNLKLRIGYGQTGQQDIGSYFPYLATYTYGDSGSAYQFGNSFQTTLRPQAYDANIKWETTATSNIGLDYGFLDDRITGSFDYYVKKTKDLLADIPVPDGSNLTNHLYTNVGNLESKGFEFNINLNAIKSKDLNWNIGYNLSYAQVTLTNLSKTASGNQIINVGGIPGGVGNTIQAYYVGQTPNVFLVNKQVYDASGAPIEGVYVDVNKNGQFDTGNGDKYFYKQPNPKFYMGFNSSLNYKKFDLSFSMRANLGNYIYNAFAASTGAVQGIQFSNYLGNLSSSVLATNFQKYQLWSDYYIENASFLRMDYANLGYNFGKIHGNSTLRMSFNVSNVFVVTKYTGLDPEVQSGIDNNFYPRPRVFSLGLNLSL